MFFKRHIVWTHAIYFTLILLSVISICLLAGVPPVDRDALTHHLYVPKLYLLNGGIYEIPYIPFSYYPMNLDLLYMLSLYFNNDIAPKYIHFAFALITALMLFRYLVRRINKEYALLGSLFFITLPLIVRLSSTVYVDLGLICFLFISMLYIFKWIESGFKLKPLIVSGIFCGLALGTKYNGLLGLFLLGMAVPFIYIRYYTSRYNSQINQSLTGLKALGFGALFVFTALLIFSPWMIRNQLWTGNPVYPLYNSVFNPQKNVKPEITKEDKTETVIGQRSKMTPIQIRKEIYGESWIEIVLIPIRVFFQGKDDTPKYFDGKISPFLLILSLFSFLGFRSRSKQVQTEILLMAFFSVFMLLYACSMTGIRIRYFSPILPALVVMSMFGLYNICKYLPGFLYKQSKLHCDIIIYIIVFVMLGMNFVYLVERFKKDQPLAYILGKVDRDEYIQACRPEYAAFQYANEHLNKDAKILGLYLGNRGYYSDKHIEFSIEKLQQFASVSETGKGVAQILHKDGFSHLLVDVSLFNYWVQNYSLKERMILKDFFDSYAVDLFSKDGYCLLQISLTKKQPL